MTGQGKPDRSWVDRILKDNRYLVIGTADDAGTPWATPVFFAVLDPDTLVWVSAPDSRHSTNIRQRPQAALTVFDSRVEVGHAEAAYFDARTEPAEAAEIDAALTALNSRLPVDKHMGPEDITPAGRLTVYRATLQRRYVLIRGGNTHFRNVLDMRVEV
jgi:nitroimidazol reductase NimA-like FMN-containing flavoprotein (pyridoxamine 5'-phosphate oxidase superfamily)